MSWYCDNWYGSGNVILKQTKKKHIKCDVRRIGADGSICVAIYNSFCCTFRVLIQWIVISPAM